MEHSTHEVATADPRRWFALVIIAIAQLMVVLDATIVNIALPSAQIDLDISDVSRQWVVTAYSLAFGSLLLIGGRIADFWGRKRTFILGLLGFAAASALGGAATSPGMLFLARGLQGVFAALLAPAALTLVTIMFHEPRERVKAFGIYSAVSGAGAAIGLILGGFLTEYLDWRWCLYVNTPIAIVAAAIAFSILKENKVTGSTKYDIPGVILATAGLGSLVYGFSRAEEHGWGSNSTLGFLAAAVVLLAGFVWQESRASHPLLPLRVVASRNRAGAFLTALGAGVGLMAMFFFMTYYLQQNLGYSPLKSGFAYMPFTFGVVFSTTLIGRLLPVLGPRLFLACGPLLMSAGMLLLTTLEERSSYLMHVVGPMIVIASGMGMVFVTVFNTALNGLSHNDAGVGSAMVNTVQQIGGSLGIPLLSAIAASATANYLQARNGDPSAYLAASVDGFTTAFLWAAIILAATGLLAFLLVSKHVATSTWADQAPVAAH